MIQENIEAGKDNLLLEVVVPSIFLTVLVGCIAQLGLAALQNGTHQAPVTQYAYAISAFAN